MKAKPTMIATIFLTLLLTTTFTTLDATRPDPNSKQSKPKGAGPDGAGFFGPGGGFDIPGFDKNWGQGIFGGGGAGGYGYGYGTPKGGYSRSGTINPSVVCKEKGPCYMKKLKCPAKCFSSFSSSGKGYGGGGGGGGCTMDCKSKCLAYC